MCNFQTFYSNNDGYVIRCKDCGNYQVAYLSTLLTLTPNNFETLRTVVKHKCIADSSLVYDNAKSIVIPTPAKDFKILLTQKEAIQFSTILEEADTEEKTISLLELFQ